MKELNSFSSLRARESEVVSRQSILTINWKYSETPFFRRIFQVSNYLYVNRWFVRRKNKIMKELNNFLVPSGEKEWSCQSILITFDNFIKYHNWKYSETLFFWKIFQVSNYLFVNRWFVRRKDKIMKELNSFSSLRARESEVVSRFYRVLPSTRPGTMARKI